MGSGTFTLSRGAVYAMLATLMWISLPVGIYLLLNGSALWGAVLTVAALALPVIVASSGLIGTFQERQIPKSRGYFMLFCFSFSAVSTAAYSISLFQPPEALALLGTFHAAGVLGLGTWAAVELLRSFRTEGA